MFNGNAYWMAWIVYSPVFLSRVVVFENRFISARRGLTHPKEANNRQSRQTNRQTRKDKMKDTDSFETFFCFSFSVSFPFYLSFFYGRSLALWTTGKCVACSRGLRAPYDTRQNRIEGKEQFCCCCCCFWCWCFDTKYQIVDCVNSIANDSLHLCAFSLSFSFLAGQQVGKMTSREIYSGPETQRRAVIERTIGTNVRPWFMHGLHVFGAGATRWKRTRTRTRRIKWNVIWSPCIFGRYNELEF